MALQIEDLEEELFWDTVMRRNTKVTEADFEIRKQLLEDHKILILSKQAAKTFDPPANVDVVRIGDPGFEMSKLGSQAKFRNVYCFYMFDFDDEETIDDETADSIVRTYKELDGDLTVFHCFAGISRSAALAYCLADYRRDRKAQSLIAKCNFFDPNPWIVRAIRKRIK